MVNSLNHVTSCLCISYQLSVDVLGVEDSQKIESVKCIGLKRINARRERNITLKDIHCGCVAERGKTDVTAEVPLIIQMQPIKRDRKSS